MNKTIKATVAALFGYSIFGFSFLFSKSALMLTSPFVLLSVRFLTAFLVLNLVLLSRKVQISLKGKPVLPLLMMGFVQPVIYFICETYGITLTSASFSGVMIGLAPVAGLVFGVLFLKEQCTMFQVFCTVMSVVGVVLTTTGGFGKFSFMGFVLLLISVVSSALFTVLSRRISEEFSPFERTYVMSALGGVVFTMIALIQNGGNPAAWTVPLSSSDFWVSVLYLSVFSSVGAFLLINYALNHISVGRTLIFSNFTTVISVLAGIFLMHDTFSALQMVGIIIIILSVFGVSYQKESVS